MVLWGNVAPGVHVSSGSLDNLVRGGAEDHGLFALMLLWL